MAIYSFNILKNFKEKGLMDALLPIDKFGANMCERIMGICCKQEGCDPKFNSIEGNFLEKSSKLTTDGLIFFTKKYLGRQ